MLLTVLVLLSVVGPPLARFSVWVATVDACWGKPLSVGQQPVGDVVVLEGVGKPEEGGEPGVPCLYSPSDLAGVSDDLAGDLDEGLAEGAELHGQQRSALLAVLVGPAGSDGQEESAPRFDAPGEAGHRHMGAAL